MLCSLPLLLRYAKAASDGTSLIINKCTIWKSVQLTVFCLHDCRYHPNHSSHYHQMVGKSRHHPMMHMGPHKEMKSLTTNCEHRYIDIEHEHRLQIKSLSEHLRGVRVTDSPHQW